eukprot:CAMPEP_0115259666 /NCGR_PEP_ID=MMETSP0270-20121206/47942_1 /TAXON_ID=71861 /ORGANISM="Scrippsiella trochoidea, Strain CCMP3099" /LENGTH=341 /DNA_ID=CAMNT_0002675483 /DNA_START=57 /DNA_END=1082 /DNA_ORIENTATION=-
MVTEAAVVSDPPLKKAKTCAPAHATAHFMKDDVPFGFADACEAGAKGRQGFAVAEELMEGQTLQLTPIPAEATFEREGVELLDVRAELEAVGITEDNFDPTCKDHRLAVGSVLIRKAEQRFGPGKKGVHMADTSRVSGAAVYGEATVRDTTPGSSLRMAHHAFHMDKFLPGVAKFWNKAGKQEGAKAFVDTYWQHWKPDFARFNMDEVATATCVEKERPGLVNLWVSLTKGEIEQQPLVVMDKQSIELEGEEGLRNVSTVPVTFPGLRDTLTILRSRAVEKGRWFWRPKMRFGEVLLFSTTTTPHSAVWLKDAPLDKPRRSAEMRIFIVDDTCASSAQVSA